MNFLCLKLRSISDFLSRTNHHMIKSLNNVLSSVTLSLSADSAGNQKTVYISYYFVANLIPSRWIQILLRANLELRTREGFPIWVQPRGMVIGKVTHPSVWSYCQKKVKIVSDVAAKVSVFLFNIIIFSRYFDNRLPQVSVRCPDRTPQTYGAVNGLCWKSENRFDILKDDDDVIAWHIWCDNVTPTFVAVISNHFTKYIHEY